MPPKLFLLIFLSHLNLILAQECGIRARGFSFSVGGIYSKEGEWPWLAPLFRKKDDEFFCSSSIISERVLLSAAHCAQDKKRNQRKDANDIFAYVGRYDFERSENHAKKIDIAEMHMHPSWKPDATSYDGDLLLLKTASKIVFSDFIKPVCLPLFNEAVFDVNGFVAGYGITEENSQHETRPKHIQIKSVHQETCIYNNTVIANIFSPRTFCAGERGKNPCQGDSGGGYYVRHGNRFEIIGIVSAAPSSDCASNVYVLFTNVPKFVGWIKEVSGEVQCKTTATCTMSNEDAEGLKCTIIVNLGSEQDCKVYLSDASNTQLKRLSLLGGSMVYVPDLSDAMEKFEYVEKIDFGWVGIRYVERKKMRLMKNIKWVSFFGNQIDHLYDDTFVDLTKVEKILLANNKLKILDENLFINNVKLEEIWLQSNQLVTIPQGLFRNNKALKTVFLGENKLKKIKIDFRALPVFKNIDLRGNECIDEWCGETSWCGQGTKEGMQLKILSNCGGR